ncbi:MAG: D-cysteine desulfhydrase family protein [Candidatus Eremiobacteraeota bacterium]|nr:D-cysteine desulfhydrase family protein [Candidatus Eremiobacteraeota bacterium]
MDFPFPEKITLARTPTPIEEFKYPVLPGEHLKLYVKRDDLTECAATGNKARKLEYLAAAALKEKADTLVTCGGVQSNHARATAFFAARLGLKCVLVLRGEEPAEIDGNLLLDRLLGASIIYISRSQWSERMSLMEEIGASLARKGRKAFIIPEGASNALGSVGYIEAAREISRQCAGEQKEFDYIVCATGSGGTQAGLIMGCRLYLPRTGVVGFNVCDDAEYFQNRITSLISETESLYGVPFNVRPEDISIIDGYVGRGYAINTGEELDLIGDVARSTGLLLDPVYNGKSFYGLLKEAQKGRFTRGSSILFLHSGGIFGLFPKKGEFSFLSSGS